MHHAPAVGGDETPIRELSGALDEAATPRPQCGAHRAAQAPSSQPATRSCHTSPPASAALPPPRYRMAMSAPRSRVLRSSPRTRVAPLPAPTPTPAWAEAGRLPAPGAAMITPAPRQVVVPPPGAVPPTPAEDLATFHVPSCNMTSHHPRAANAVVVNAWVPLPQGQVSSQSQVSSMPQGQGTARAGAGVSGDAHMETSRMWQAQPAMPQALPTTQPVPVHAPAAAAAAAQQPVASGEGMVPSQQPISLSEGLVPQVTDALTSPSLEPTTQTTQTTQASSLPAPQENVDPPAAAMGAEESALGSVATPVTSLESQSAARSRAKGMLGGVEDIGTLLDELFAPPPSVARTSATPATPVSPRRAAVLDTSTSILTDEQDGGGREGVMAFPSSSLHSS